MPSPLETTEQSVTTLDCVRFDDFVEVKQPDEDAVIAEINAVMGQSGAIMLDRFHHAIRPVHAKSHEILEAELEVYGGLPEPLRQGLFDHPAVYPAILRFSTNPGDILPDSISTPRGLAVKVLSVEGYEILPERAGETTQDFVFANGKQFASKNSAGFLQQQKLIEKHVGDDPAFKQVVSDVTRGTNAVLTAVGHESAKLEGLGYPKTHILGETFSSQTVLRYGDYIAKIIIAPLSGNLRALTNEHLHTRGHYSALKEVIQESFQTETTVWEVRIQLCTDLEKMPIEDAASEWSEDLSPYVPVAKLTALRQETYSPARRVYVDDGLSFNPWHSLAARRPLGSIMRARQASYAAAREQRIVGNARSITEPRSIQDLPD